MPEPLDPVLVEARLREAARLFQWTHVDELREPPPERTLHPDVVQARLDELRALLELVDYLGKARV